LPVAAALRRYAIGCHLSGDRSPRHAIATQLDDAPHAFDFMVDRLDDTAGVLVSLMRIAMPAERGRPELGTLSLRFASPSAVRVRSPICARSNSAKTLIMPKTIRPIGPVVSSRALANHLSRRGARG
jgi:hypothetical protein